MVDPQVPPTGIYGKMALFEGRSWTGCTIKTTGMRKTRDTGLLLLLLTPEAAGMDASMTFKRLNNITAFKVVVVFWTVGLAKQITGHGQI